MTAQTQPAQPEALRLADELVRRVQETKTGLTFDGTLAYSAAELRSQHARIAELEAELVREAQRTAAEKLRADQMTEQHRMQAAMNSEARAELAQLRKSRKPLSDERMHELMQEHAFCIGPMTYAFGRSVEAAHGIGEKTP